MSQKIYTDRTELEEVELPSAGQTRILVVDENKKIKSEANGGNLTVTDNDEEDVSNVDTINFVGATVTDNEDGSVDVSFPTSGSVDWDAITGDQSDIDISGFNNDSGFTTNTGTVTSVGVSGSDGIEIDSGSPVTGSGTIALGINASTLRSHINVADGAQVNVKSDWNSGSGDSEILNKPTLGSMASETASDYSKTEDFHEVAFSGDYDDLENKPSIPADISDLTDTDNLLFSGDYDDLENKPTLVTAFTGLSDTPANYSGQGSKAVAVNSEGTALEFVEFPDTTPFNLVVDDGDEEVSNVNKINFVGATVTDDDDGEITVTVEGGGGAEWGDIGGTLSAQTDLQSALDVKEDKRKLTFVEASSSSGAATAAKTATTVGGSYTPTKGDIVYLSLSNANTNAAPTLNIDGSGAYPIQLGGNTPTNIPIRDALRYPLWFDGSAYQLFGSQRLLDDNTTYVASTLSLTVTTTFSATLTTDNYRVDNYTSGKTLYTLPSISNRGSIIEIYGLAVNGFRITAGTGDNILMGGYDSGAAGWIETFDQGVTIKLRCIANNTTWEVVSVENGTVINNNGDTFTTDPNKMEVVTKRVKVTIPANDFRECFSTPVELIPAQGAGKVISVKSVTAFVDYGTTPYDFAYSSAEQIVLYTGTDSAVSTATIRQNAFNVSADTYLGFNAFGGSIDSGNSPLMLTASSDATQGDSPVTFIIDYTVHDYN